MKAKHPYEMLTEANDKISYYESLLTEVEKVLEELRKIAYFGFNFENPQQARSFQKYCDIVNQLLTKLRSRHQS